MLDLVLHAKLVTKNRCLGSHEVYFIFLDINQIVTLVMYICKLKGTEVYEKILQINLK